MEGAQGQHGQARPPLHTTPPPTQGEAETGQPRADQVPSAPTRQTSGPSPCSISRDGGEGVGQEGGRGKSFGSSHTITAVLETQGRVWSLANFKTKS